MLDLSDKSHQYDSGAPGGSADTLASKMRRISAPRHVLNCKPVGLLCTCRTAAGYNFANVGESTIGLCIRCASRVQWSLRIRINCVICARRCIAGPYDPAVLESLARADTGTLPKRLPSRGEITLLSR